MPSDIDRLITLGLNRYGAGDLDGAILMWEEALAVDPDNLQASSYIEYVKLNYELLASAELALAPSDDTFGIEEEPEYQIEITPGELVAVESPSMPDTVDTGWFDEFSHGEAAQASEPLELELDLEPLLPPTIEAREPESEPEIDLELGPAGEINFEDRTREYQAARQSGLPLAPPRAGDFAEVGTGEFPNEETTGGFRPQSTEVFKRDLGFVQPAEMTGERTKPSGRPQNENELAPFSFEPSEDDRLATKPRIKRPTGGPLMPAPELTDRPWVGERTTKREMPEPRPPARHDTVELPQAEGVLVAKPHELEEAPRIDLTAPTRDLGMRPKTAPGLTNPDDEEELPTKQSDARAFREMVTAERPETRQDVMLSFDPIIARSEHILSEIDAGAPDDEPIEDQTRRRIGALIERAVAWNAAEEFDRAVAAVDLALSEDPASVLAQKLITRNRDTIMSIFQGFIGDLTRQPQLAKPLHELQQAPINPRAAFLLSRVDGTLTIDELLDVSGMPRMEAYRYLCQLLLRGILR